MSKISPETIEKYQEILRKDPASKVFAALADAYRENGMTEVAESVGRRGIEKNPEYVGGYVALSRLLCAERRFEEALPYLTKAAQLAPENLLAYQLLGQAYIELKQPREALKAHKMALFLNPMSERSKKAVEKLETVSADEYEEDLFQMKPLPEALETLHRTATTPSGPKQTLSERIRSVETTGFKPSARAREMAEQEQPSSKFGKSEKALLSESDEMRRKDRQLSLIDALIVRNEITRAQVMADDLFMSHPEDPEVRKRWELLRDDEEVVELRPRMTRERAVVDRQLKILKNLLNRALKIKAIGPDL